MLFRSNTVFRSNDKMDRIQKNDEERSVTSTEREHNDGSHVRSDAHNQNDDSRNEQDSGSSNDHSERADSFSIGGILRIRTDAHREEDKKTDEHKGDSEL